jgi:hypothetical protein
MDPRVREILMRNDASQEWECPNDFDWDKSFESVKRFKSAVEAELGRPLELDDKIQDASHFAEVAEFENTQLPNGALLREYRIGIRFSTFGNMATVFSNNPKHQVAQELRRAIADLLHLHGFVYVDVSALNERYDGKIVCLCENATWWDRFFDYT